MREACVLTPCVAAQSQVTALFYSGSYLSGVQELVSTVEDIELLSFQAPGEAVQDFDTSGVNLFGAPPQIACVVMQELCCWVQGHGPFVHSGQD